MIHNDVLAQLQFLVKNAAPPLVEVAEHPANLPKWVPGQRLSAAVLAMLPSGRFQVQVSDMVLDMNLPRNTQPGEKLDLTFVSNQPRLTFVLTQDMAASQGKPAVSLSEAAKFLGGLLDKLSQLKGEQASPLAKTTPLLAGAPRDTQQLSHLLQQTLSKSGLFYESHQAQWVAGQRPLTELLQEPQGRLSQAAHAHQQQVPLSQTQTAGQPAKADATTAMAARELGAAHTSRPAAESVHPHTYPLVQQQLGILDGRQLLWQGQVWPGQEMRWEIEEREANRQEGGEEEAINWKTTLRLQMPRLGNVTATLALEPQGVKVRLAVVENTIQSQMRHAQPALDQALEAAGLRLTGFAVESDGST